MKTSRYSLRSYWDELTDGFRRMGREQSFNLVYGSYFERHRHYHTLDHIKEMFAHFEEHRGKLKDPQSVIAAIFYHDVIYNTSPTALKSGTSNEEASAELASKELRQMGYDQGFIDRVKFLIMRTQDHKVDANKDPDAALFLDIDMAVLGREPEEYKQYSDQIRSEYSFLSDADYCKGRLEKFIRPILQSGPIFHTESFRNLYEEQARKNLTAEQRQLEQKLWYINNQNRRPPYMR